MFDKFIQSVLLAVSLVASPAYAFANSGPVFWQGYPAAETISVQQDSPIAIQQEDLTFDFSAGERQNYSLAAQVKARYDMVNTAYEPCSVTLAFPFVGSVRDLDAKQIAITAAGHGVPYQIFLGDRVEAGLDLDTVVGGLTAGLYTSDRLPADTMGTLYRLAVANDPEQEDYEVELQFTLADPDQIVLASDGFRSFGSNGSSFTLAFRPSHNEVVEILSLNGPLQADIVGYTDRQHPDTQPLCEVTSQAVRLYDYLVAAAKSSEYYQPAVSDLQYYNMLAKELERSTVEYGGCVPLVDLLSAAYYERAITLLYALDFGPQEAKETLVTYVATGTMDYRDQQNPFFQYEYLLEPARYWQDFGTLHVELIMPIKDAYRLESNLALTQTENGYHGQFEQLPAGNWQFSLHSTAPASQGGFGMDYSQSFIFIVAIVVIGGLLVSSFWGYHKSKRAYQEALEEQKRRGNQDSLS